MLVIGQKEAEQGTVTVRDRLDADHQQTIPVAQALEQLLTEVRERRIRQTQKPPPPSSMGAGDDTPENEY
jgi:threonyl-tRNA synthetase